MTTADPLAAHDRVVTEIAWVGAHELLVKETDRSAARERTALFDFSAPPKSRRQTAGMEGHDDALKSAGRKLEGFLTRDINWEKIDGGWAETGQTVIGLESAALAAGSATDIDSSDLAKGYLEIVPDKKGFSHIAIYSPASSREPVFLTSGEWEIDGEIRAIDVKRKLMYVGLWLSGSAGLTNASAYSYFIAANPSTERYLYSIPLPFTSELSKIRSGLSKPAEPTPLTDHSKLDTTGFYDVSFSPGAGFYLLEQKAGIPWQKVEKVGDPNFDFPLTDNHALNGTLGLYLMPKTTYKTVQANGVCKIPFHLRRVTHIADLSIQPSMLQRHSLPTLMLAETQSTLFSYDPTAVQTLSKSRTVSG